MRHVKWTNDINDPGQVVSIYAYSPTNDSFHTGYLNKEVEELYLATQGETDTSRRHDLFQKLQTLYNEDSPIMFLVETPLPVAMRSNVEGFVQIPLGNQVFKETRVK
jgi:peptide/nickel transport system substrate-binding protein